MSGIAVCVICGEPMPEGEEMFQYHGYSGDCPKPPLPRLAKPTYEELEADISEVIKGASIMVDALRKLGAPELPQEIKKIILKYESNDSHR